MPNPKFHRVRQSRFRRVEASFPFKVPASAVTNTISEFHLPQQATGSIPTGFPIITSALEELTRWRPDVAVKVNAALIDGLGVEGANGALTNVKPTLTEVLSQPTRFRALSLYAVKASFDKIGEYLAGSGMGTCRLSRILQNSGIIAKLIPIAVLGKSIYDNMHVPDPTAATSATQADPSQAAPAQPGAAFETANRATGSGSASQNNAAGYVAPNYVSTPTIMAPPMMGTTGQYSGYQPSSPYRFDSNGYILTNPDAESAGSVPS